MGSIDRLSALPDSLLVHILSFVCLDSNINVNVRDAARTSVLSKRWRYLWCELKSLQFSHFGANNIVEISKFVAMVHRILLSRTATLEEFNVNFDYNEAWASHVDIWVELALKLKSKIVRLSLPTHDSIPYLPPGLLYSNSVMTELSMEYCTVAPGRRVDWKSLNKLRLKCVELHQHVVENILLGCPVLCSLELCGCWGFNRLEIDSPRLRKLSVIELDENASEEMLEISAPYLSILDIIIPPDGRKVWLKNISAVVEVEVDLVFGFYYAEETPAHVSNAVKELFKDIQHIKKIHMKINFFQYLSMMVADGFQLQQQSRLLSLKIDHILYINNIKSSVLSLLESCPNLETLQLHEVPEESPLHSRLSMSDDLNCDLLHLKMVEMKITVTIDEVNVESSSMLVLVRILLRRAVALEKMEIRFEILHGDVKIEDREKFDNVVQELLSWPKSSQALLITSLIPRTNSRI